MYNNNNYQIEKTYTNKTSSLALIALNISLCYLILTAVPSQLQCSMIILTKKVALIFRCASISWFEVVSRSVIDIFTASASTGLSDYFVLFPICYCMNDPPSSSFFLQTCVQGKLRRLSSTQILCFAFLSTVTFQINIPSIIKKHK